MEGVRRNIALKLKPSGKDGAPHKSPSDGSKKKEAPVREAASTASTVEDLAPPPPPPPPPAPDPQTSYPIPLPLAYQAPPTTFPDAVRTISPPPGPLSSAGISSVSGKVPPEGTIETGASLCWEQKVNLLGRAVQDPLVHLCEVCLLPVLIYGRMKRCRHAFCRDCAKKSGGVCPRCKEGEQTFEEASMGNVYICTHGGGRYDNKGCGRSYLSQRDLEAHITYRHKDKSALPPAPPGPPGIGLTSQSALPPLPMPPTFFTMRPGLPPNFPLPTLPPMPPPNIQGPTGQHMFPPRLPQVPTAVVFVSQGNTTVSAPVPLPPTWTTR